MLIYNRTSQKAIFIFFISFVFLFGCNNQEIKLFEDHIDRELKEFHLKVSARGLIPRDVELEEDLHKELEKVTKEHKGSLNELFVKKLNIINEYRDQVDSGRVVFDNIIPYYVELSQDSSILLFDLVHLGVMPNVFLKEGDSARQIQLSNYKPITIMSNKKWSDSNGPIFMKKDRIGYYTIPQIDGRDGKYLIKKKITCY